MLNTQLKIDDYHIYYLRLSLLDIVQLERLLGDSPLNIIQNAMNSNRCNIGVEELIYILYVSLQGGDINYSIDDAYDIFDSYTENVGDISSFIYILIRLFSDMGLIGDGSEYYDELIEDKDDIDDNNEDVVVEDITLETRFKRLLIRCLEAGITEEFFWNSTYGEMLRYMKAYSNRLHRERQDRAFFDYQLSNLIGISVSRLFSSDSSLPDISDVYPGIFEPPSEEELMAQEVMKMKARMIEYTEQHNAKKQLREIEELYGIKLDNQ